MAASAPSMVDWLICGVAVMAALAYLVRRYTSQASGCGACPSKRPQRRA